MDMTFSHERGGPVTCKADRRRCGAKTRAGIRAYQIVHGYQPTGYLTSEQLWVLGVDREKR